MPALKPAERAIVGRVFVERLRDRHNLLIVACAPTHVHALFEAGDEDVLHILGSLKQSASRRLTSRTGRIWGRGGGADRIRSESHRITAFEYINQHREEGAWVWRFDGERGAGAQ